MGGGGAEDQLADARVAVGAHDDEVGLLALGVFQDALLLLGVAVVFSLVLGVGLALARGTELLREPSWWAGSEQTAGSLPSPAADVVPAVARGAAVQPSAPGA